MSAPVDLGGRTISSSQSGRGDLVVVDHQEIGRGGNVASAVSNAALMAWQLPCRSSTTQSAREFSRRKKFSGDRNAAARRGIVFDDDDREAPVGALTGQRLQRQAQDAAAGGSRECRPRSRSNDRAKATTPPMRGRHAAAVSQMRTLRTTRLCRKRPARQPLLALTKKSGRERASIDIGRPGSAAEFNG